MEIQEEQTEYVAEEANEYINKPAYPCTSCHHGMNLHRIKKECHQLFCHCEAYKSEAEVCTICGGSGEVPEVIPVFAGEPHMADVGTRKCVCQIPQE